MKTHRATTAMLAALFLAGTAALARGADRKKPERARGEDDDRNDYRVTILVSNEADEAPHVDANLVNAWGISASGTSPWWVANNGTGTSTIYDGDGNPAGPQLITVPGAPTGTVFNGSGSFQMASGAPALFLFASEDGTFSGWNPNVNAGAAIVVHSEDGANYKGLAILGATLYSPDFGSCSVDSFHGNFFDGTFEEFDTSGGFADSSIPSGYCPFGIQAVGDSIFVTYAKKEGDDEAHGVGLGFVRQFDGDGNLVAKVASHGLLNAPWGLAMAPEDFGKFGGCLLVGNFGDGKINAYCKNDHHGEGAEHGQDGWHHAGRLKEKHHTLVIDGLWGIGFGNGHAAGPENVLYFAAGPDDESNGYYGRVEFHHDHD
jgi:uncharacterized protein (TIGR03118 family)